MTFEFAVRPASTACPEPYPARPVPSVLTPIPIPVVWHPIPRMPHGFGTSTAPLIRSSRRRGARTTLGPPGLPSRGTQHFNTSGNVAGTSVACPGLRELRLRPTKSTNTRT
ncbi:hypothetical protein GSI_11760 [Ganoderma sinense ZZ0214-1]|uniref:Uncharacterized protein n=1 Tax=Ganoderma sinense ZZ0214-1 TaxID=1077348 RepID=A0A2G8RWW0_9APHY|nr:hypothetical protein GSI_11760 [Ganoderma sinense ZZ0214-1]